MSTLVARKRLKYDGRSYEPGQPIVPEPEGPRRQLLLEGRYVVETADPVTEPAPPAKAKPAKAKPRGGQRARKEGASRDGA